MIKKTICAAYAGIGMFAGACWGIAQEGSSLTRVITDSSFGMLFGASLGGASVLYYYIMRTEEEKNIAQANRSLKKYLARGENGLLPVEKSILKSIAILGNFLDEMEIPEEFRCPISHAVMHDPITLPDNRNYERHEVYQWYLHGQRTCPASPWIKFENDPIDPVNTPTNLALQSSIEKFLCKEVVKIQRTKEINKNVLTPPVLFKV